MLAGWAWEDLNLRPLRYQVSGGRLNPSPRTRTAASGDVTEVDRTVNASGNVSLGDHMIGAGLPLAGQRVTLRLDGPVAHSSGRGGPGPPRNPQAGLSQACKTVQINVGPDTYQVTVEPGIAVTAARTGSRDIRRDKASNYSPEVPLGVT